LITGAFPRAPADYARSRSFSPEAERQIAGSLHALLPAASHVLDLGAGTGRLAHLLLASGFGVTAFDLSRPMLEYLRAHRPSSPTHLRLVQADVSALPLPARSAEAAISVHVLHLVPDWRRTLGEAIRVLAPGATLLLGWTEHEEDDPWTRISRKWRETIASHGYEVRTEVDYDEEVCPWLTARSATTGSLTAARWDHTRPPRQYLEGIRQRLYPFFWSIPDEAFPRLLEELENWAARTFHDLGAPVLARESFVWRVYTMPETRQGS
jgi:ubiquinone/menaquinone biosynthesis C-methylase UbiE